MRVGDAAPAYTTGHSRRTGSTGGSVQNESRPEAAFAGIADGAWRQWIIMK